MTKRDYWIIKIQAQVKLYIAIAKQAYVLCHLHLRPTTCEPMPTLAMDDLHLPICSNRQCREVSEQVKTRQSR